jgi:DNA-binding MarR family transcriptional regulator
MHPAAMKSSNAASFTEQEALASGLRRLWGTIVQGMRQGDSVDGLHLQQFWVLVLTKDGPVRMSEIAASLETSQANVTGLVDRLEAAGYVSRVRAEDDRRVVNVAMTDRGRAMLMGLRERYLERVETALGRLDDADRRQLLALLNKALGEE